MILSVPAFYNVRARDIAWCGVVLAYTVFRTIRPVRYTDDTSSLVQLLAEVGINVLAVSSTGYWNSPFVFSLLTAVIVAGFARGFGFALRIGAISAAAVGFPDLVQPGHDLRVGAQWSVELLLVALVAGYARRISGEADRQHSLALDRLGRLADANALLFSLHRVAQTLPASLDLDEVLDSTVSRMRDLFAFDAAAVLLYDETDQTWLVARRDGSRINGKMKTEELPPPLTRAIALRSFVEEPNLLVRGGPGLAPRSYSGIYAVLPARGSIIGLISIEHHEPFHFTARDMELLSGFVEPAALAVDNARWFARLRTVGADEERTRIARDLHDRIGQSLAYLAFELDRIVKKDHSGDDVSDSLQQLRADVRGVIREVRDTLYDLRTDVSDSVDMLSVLSSFLLRVEERSGMELVLRTEGDGRLPLPQEREMFRIAQEAVINVERHARADRVTVTWHCDGESAYLEVADDGEGFPIGTAGRLDSYGILGMRERAASIGATLDIVSAPGKGTRVRCRLHQ